MKLQLQSSQRKLPLRLTTVWVQERVQSLWKSKKSSGAFLASIKCFEKHLKIQINQVICSFGEQFSKYSLYSYELHPIPICQRAVIWTGLQADYRNISFDLGNAGLRQAQEVRCCQSCSKSYSTEAEWFPGDTAGDKVSAVSQHVSHSQPRNRCK